jgi:hypothetical protein
MNERGMLKKSFDFTEKYRDGDLKEICDEGIRLVREMLIQRGVSEERIIITSSQIDSDGKDRYFVRVALWEPHGRYKVYFDGLIEN